MKQEIVVKIFWIIFGIVVAILGLTKFNRYLDAQIAYDREACSQQSYMIYKGYDDQAEDVKRQDWLKRIDACSEIEAQYLQ